MSDTHPGSGSSSDGSASDPYASTPYQQQGQQSPYQQSQPYSASSASEWPSYPGTQPSAPEPYPTTPAYGQPAGPDQNVPAPYGAAPYGSNPYDTNSYGANPYGANPYAAAGYAGQYGYAPPNHPSATPAMVLGIIGVVTAIPFVGIAGFVLGRKARREIDASPQTYGGRGMATAGWVLGIIAIVYAAFVVLAVILFIIGIAASSQS